MTESINDIFRRNHCKTPEWLADLEIPCFDLEIQEFLEEHAFFKIFAAHCFHEIRFRVAIFSIQILFKGSFQSCNKSLLTKLPRDRIGRISALGPFCRTSLRTAYSQDLGPIFSQYDPRAWLIRFNNRRTSTVDVLEYTHIRTFAIRQTENYENRTKHSQ